MILSRTTPQILSRVSFGATCHSAYNYDGPLSAVFFTHASRSHITFTISTGIPYQLILGSRRPTCTNHSLRLSFDIRFWGLVRPHIFPLSIYRGTAYVLLFSHDLYGSNIDRHLWRGKFIGVADIFYREYLPVC